MKRLKKTHNCSFHFSILVFQTKVDVCKLNIYFQPENWNKPILDRSVNSLLILLRLLEQNTSYAQI